MLFSPPLELIAGCGLVVVWSLLCLLGAVGLLNLLCSFFFVSLDGASFELAPEIVELSGVLFKIEWMVDDEEVLLVV